MSDSLTTGLTQEQHLLRASISQILVKNGLRTDQVAILELVRLMQDYKAEMPKPTETTKRRARLKKVREATRTLETVC